MSFIYSALSMLHDITDAIGGGAVSDVMPRGITTIQSGSKQKKEIKSIFASDLSLLTMFEIHGTRNHYNNDVILETLLSISTSLKSSMKFRGHTLQICMHHDRNMSPRLIHEIMEPFSRAANALDITIGPIIKDWENVMTRFTAGEKMFLALWTHPTVMEKTILKEALKKRKVVKVDNNCMNPTQVIPELQTHHLTALSSVNKALGSERLVYDELTAEESVRAMRMFVDESYTPSTWEPWTEKGTRMASYPMMEYNGLAHEWVMPEHLGHQIVPRDFDVVNQNMVYIGDKLHFPFMCKLMPKEAIGFRAGFFTEAIKHTFPWRITWTICSGGEINNIKRQMAILLNKTSSDNRKINDAYDSIIDYIEKGEGVPVNVQVSYDTWIDTPIPTKDDVATLKRQQAQFAGIIQSWGTQEVVNVVGDPSSVFFSTIPGINWQSPAPVTLMPIEDVFSYLPLVDRAASPWKIGLPLRTLDGKLFPYMSMSNKQASWITFGFATMGSGKSVMSNVNNFCYVFNPELSDIPFLYIIDVGLSSLGLVQLIEEHLPAHKKHYACAFTLDNNSEHGINPFDTRLGCYIPTKSHYDFLVNYLTLLATPVESAAAPEGIDGFVKACIKYAYNECSPKKHPNLYKPGNEIRVDKWIRDTEYPVDKKTTWWELTEAIFRDGKPIIAGYAQRYASPTLSNILKASSQSIVRHDYLEITMSTNEKLPDFFFRRISNVYENNPILRGVTKFDIGDARVASIDLDKFKGSSPEDRKLMAIMFMLSQHVMAGKFYSDWSDLDSVPELYKKYHEQEIKLIKSLPKMLCMDELHKITQRGKNETNNIVADQFIGDICSRARESRKWGVAYSFWSQIFHDIPEQIIKLASTVYIMGINTYEEAEEIQKIYDMSPEMAHAMAHMPQPGSHGSSMLAWYKTKEGNYYHILTLTIGLYMLWSLSSTKDERNIREALVKKFGFGKALDILVKLYPRDIIKIIESRQLEESKKESGINVIDEIIKECIAYGNTY